MGLEEREIQVGEIVRVDEIVKVGEIVKDALSILCLTKYENFDE